MPTRKHTSRLKSKYAEQWTKEQKNLRDELIKHDDFPWKLINEAESAPSNSSGSSSSSSSSQPLKYVGGVDISFVKNSDAACASLVVLSYPDLDPVYESCLPVTMDLPYICGFLAFREVSHLIRLIEKLRHDAPDLMPDVILVDGNGVLHPRGFGLASHLGVLADIPTVGIGKNILVVDGMEPHIVNEWNRKYLNSDEGKDSYILKGHSGRVWGAALLGRPGIRNPVYVSIGHRISLETALNLTRNVSKFRIPEPVRLADKISRNYIRKNYPESS